MARNRVRKGLVVERHAIAVLEAQGYVVHRCVRHTFWTPQGRRTKSADIFGVIDLVAKRPPSTVGTGAPWDSAATRWIQVTADGGVGRRRAEMSTVPWHPADSVELWRWVGGEGPRTDARTRTEACPEGKLRPRMYFQVYLHWQDYRLDRRNRVFVHPEAAGASAASEAPLTWADMERVGSEANASPPTRQVSSLIPTR